MSTGYISKVQRNSSIDGPGIRSTVFAVGCNLSCLWCANPELIGDKKRFLHHPRKCIGCGACVVKSGGLIKPAEDGSGVKIDRDTADLETISVACYFDAYERVGITVDAKDLAIQILADKPIFEKSRGGVTFSGGEPSLQHGFFKEVSKHLKKADIHIALDTAGFIPWETLYSLVRDVDLVLYDIKTLNRTIHKRYTGVDNQLILENAIKIAEIGKPMIIRMIIVPGVSDSEEEITGRLKFAKALGKNIKVEIIKYHKHGAGKYASLGMIEMMAGTNVCPDETADYAVRIAQNMGISATIVKI